MIYNNKCGHAVFLLFSCCLCEMCTKKSHTWTATKINTNMNGGYQGSWKNEWGLELNNASWIVIWHCLSPPHLPPIWWVFNPPNWKWGLLLISSFGAGLFYEIGIEIGLEISNFNGLLSSCPPPFWWVFDLPRQSLALVWIFIFVEERN